MDWRPTSTDRSDRARAKRIALVQRWAGIGNRLRENRRFPNRTDIDRPVGKNFLNFFPKLVFVELKGDCFQPRNRARTTIGPGIKRANLGAREEGNLPCQGQVFSLPVVTFSGWFQRRFWTIPGLGSLFRGSSGRDFTSCEVSVSRGFWERYQLVLGIPKNPSISSWTEIG